jgi:hypothetical protein
VAKEQQHDSGWQVELREWMAKEQQHDSGWQVELREWMAKEHVSHQWMAH